MSTSFQDENYKIVNLGPEMTPDMREAIQAALLQMLNDGIAHALDRGAVKEIIDATIDRIEQTYLGIGKAALKDIQKVIEERKAI